MAKQVVLVVAHNGYQHIEYNVPKKILEDAGVTVLTASDKTGRATGKDGSTTSVDLLVEEINPENYNGIFLIGGPGALEHLDNDTTHKLIQDCMKTDTPYGAICISTRILASAGGLIAKEATGWDGDGELTEVFRKHGVIYVKRPVVTEGTIVTAVGPDNAQEFAQEILKLV